MGTSSSSNGPGPKSPLVPPWADDQPDQPLPDPVGQRFRGFRQSFGQFVEHGGQDRLRSSLRKYVSSATGGSNIGPRRFGPAYVAGGGLFGLLGELQGGGNGTATIGMDLSALVGQTIERAGQAIAAALAPGNADADRIAAAIQEALAEALPDADLFDPASLTPDQIIVILIEFLARVLFQQVTEDAGSAWNKTPDGQRTVAAEAELFDVIHTCIDKHLAPRVAGGVGRMSRADVEGLQRAAMADVWRVWENGA